MTLAKTSVLKPTAIVEKYGRVKHDYLRYILKAIIFGKTENYYSTIHQLSQPSEFEPGKSKIHYGGRVFDEKEMINLIDSSLDFWLTTGKYAQKFEKEFAEFLGVKSCLLTNSGSSANLLAFMALTSDLLDDRKIARGDEVITVAAAFPTTVSPIVQYGAIPVFVDVELETYNVDCAQLEDAISERTKAVMLAHTLGNPFNINKIQEFCNKHNLWLIEDNCDALGSEYAGRYTGTFGDIATCSFYPPHHITMGEGGAVLTGDSLLKKILLSFRDWGRDCQCNSGQDNLCGKRFSSQLGELPYGYDHKYVYSHFGYNLKLTDMQAAIGCAQLEKLPDFIRTRRKNHALLLQGLKKHEDKFLLPSPTKNSKPSWFGFMLTLRDGTGFTRKAIVDHLEEKGIQTRMLFSGNLINHPCFNYMRRKECGHRIVGQLKNTDKIMHDSFWLGVYPGMTTEKTEFVIDTLSDFVSNT
ncbi:MAG: lipopolysaccharide biosynthesis protein RfbH [bacterium]|nr:lipopolysaccharide biosynthesis protein RfbH [bacterium]